MYDVTWMNLLRSPGTGVKSVGYPGQARFTHQPVSNNRLTLAAGGFDQEVEIGRCCLRR